MRAEWKEAADSLLTQAGEGDRRRRRGYRAEMCILPEDPLDLLRSLPSRLVLHVVTNERMVSAVPTELPKIFSPLASPGKNNKVKLKRSRRARTCF